MQRAALELLLVVTSVVRLVQFLKNPKRVMLIYMNVSQHMWQMT